MFNWTHILEHVILWKYNLCWLGLTTNQYFLLTWTHIFDHDISKKILCWLGLTTSLLLYVDLYAHHWSCYILEIYSMLTGTHNIIISCWLGITWLRLHSMTYSVLTGTHKINISLCWLWLVSLIMLFYENIFYVDWDSQTWRLYSM